MIRFSFHTSCTKKNRRYIVVICLITTLVVNLISYTPYDIHAADNTSQVNQSTNLISDTGWLVQILSEKYIGWWQVAVAVASIGLTVYFYFHQQKKERKEAIKRSSEAILQEMEGTNRALNSEEYEKIEYRIQNGPKGQCEVKYTNVYLDNEAYESVLYSGFFTFFSANTQHKLTLLYGRIKSHNELISYVDHFQDLYFMNHDNTKENVDKWYQNVQRYDILLTKWEEEMTQLLEEVKGLIESERPR
jgi:hypothetical protein